MLKEIKEEKKWKWFVRVMNEKEIKAKKTK